MTFQGLPLELTTYTFLHGECKRVPVVLGHTAAGGNTDFPVIDGSYAVLPPAAAPSNYDGKQPYFPRRKVQIVERTVVYTALAGALVRLLAGTLVVKRSM